MKASDVAGLQSRIGALETQLNETRAELAAARQREESLKAALAPLEESLAQFTSREAAATPPPSSSEPAQEVATPVRSQEVVSPTPTRRSATCSESDTGDFAFTNVRSNMVTVIVYFQMGSDRNVTLSVPSGQTQSVYGFPSGPHNYLVTYRAQVPIMPFPPGAPTMEQDVQYLRGQINIRQCQAGHVEIR